MRMPSDLPRRSRRKEPKSGRARAVIIVLAILVVALFLSARWIAGFYTDYLWFQSLGFDGVFTGILGAKIALTAIFTGAFFALCLVNLWIADRLAPRGRTPGPDEEFLQRYHQLVDGRIWIVRIGVSLLFALIAGLGVSGRWKDWVLFTNYQDFGTKDRQFNLDVGFYVFRLPFLSFVVSWLFAAIVIVFIITAVAHYLNGGIRIPAIGGRATPQVKAHLSMLLGALAVVRAAGYWLDRYKLTLSSRGVVDGAGYTDVKAQLPALNLLVMISVAAFVLLIVNIWRRGWALPVLAVGLWALVAVVAGTAYPAFVERFQVQPAGAAKEIPYIDRNIEATRRGLDLRVTTLPLEGPGILNTEGDPSASDAEDAQDAADVVRALDPDTDNLVDAFRLNDTGSFLKLTGLDIDRYTIDGELTPVLLTVREVDPTGIQRRTWVNEHLAYTHGEGIVMARADRTDEERGRPVLVEPGSQGLPALTRPEIYFSEDLDDYAVVGTDREQSPRDGGSTSAVYEGDGGVALTSKVRRAAFALRFAEWNLFGSGAITDDARIMFHRSVDERVREVAPFLSFDSNPYPVISEGRIKWVVDAYTTSGNLPYGERPDTSNLPAESDLRNKRFNYIRNSVKAVVDAYDGSVVLYVTDPEDPLVNAWRSAFGELFADITDAPSDLREHLRYPRDLFQIQSAMWGRYQLDDPDDFYEQLLAWTIAKNPAGSTGTASTTVTATTTEPARYAEDKGSVPPYLAILPAINNQMEFVQVRSYVRRNNEQKLVSYMTGQVDDLGRGELAVFTVQGALPDAPAVASTTAESTNEFSQFTTFSTSGDAQLTRGEVQLIPYGDTVIYARAYFVRGQGVGVPELRKVVVMYQNRTVVGDSIAEAVGEALGVELDPDQPPATDPDGPDDTTPDETADDTAGELLARADALYAEANDALKAGDLAEYQSKIDEAFDLVRRAAELAGAPTTTTPVPSTTSPSTTVSA